MDAAAREVVKLVMIARRMIALAVAYAIALQAMLSGLVAPAEAAGPTGGICVPAANSAPAAAGTPPAPALPHSMRSDCLACPAMCAGLGPARNAVTAPQPPIATAESYRTHVPVRLAPRLLPPSRAPPAA
jgi:hypothetical protein